MGMYTEIITTMRVKDEPQVIAVLKYMIGEEEVKPNPLPDHPLFGDTRWHMMLRCASHYFLPESVHLLKWNEISKYWVLISRSDFKNYDNEVEKFFDWISPYLDMGPGDVMGFSRYEETREPTIHYVPGGDNV